LAAILSILKTKHRIITTSPRNQTRPAPRSPSALNDGVVETIPPLSIEKTFRISSPEQRSSSTSFTLHVKKSSLRLLKRKHKKLPPITFQGNTTHPKILNPGFARADSKPIKNHPLLLFNSQAPDIKISITLRQFFKTDYLPTSQLNQ
jgi:hypothetical protein